MADQPRRGAPPKSLIAQVWENVVGEGDYPQPLVEIDLCERFGWTFTELDEQPMERVMPGVRAANLHAALSRVQRWIETGGKSQTREADWTAWNWAKEQVGGLVVPATTFTETD